MSENVSKNKKRVHSRQQDLNFQLKPSDTLYHLMSPNTHYAPLLLCDNKGTLLCQLNNKPFLPYQKPALLICKNIPSLHHLLRCLKTAQTFLFQQTQLLESILPQKLYSIGVDYKYSMEFPNLANPHNFYEWKKHHQDEPVLLGGICIVDMENCHCRLNLDLSLHYLSEYDYSKTLPYSFFEYLRLAITSYNDAINELYENGFTILCMSLYDKFAGILPPKTKIKEFDI